MADLCQDDFARVRPTQYFPENFREGQCFACGAYSYVGRVSKAEAEDAVKDIAAEMLRNAERDAKAAGYTSLDEYLGGPDPGLVH